MARASLSSLLFCVTVAACSDNSNVDESLGYSGPSPTSSDTDTNPDTDTSTDTSSTDETETGDPEDLEPLRYIAAGSEDSVLVSLHLDDPHDVPEPEYVANGTGLAGLFGATPFGAEAVTHDGDIYQLQLDPLGVFKLSPLVQQDGNWLHSMWFGDEGANALMSVTADPYVGPDLLLWVSYDADGKLTSSFDITPPLDPGGSVLVLGRSPDSSYAAVLIDVEPNDVWQLYLLPLHPQLSESIFIDHLTFEGVPANNVPAFMFTHIDDQRLVYREEIEVNVLSPLGVSLADPTAAPVNLAPSLGHISSIVFSDDNTRMLVSTNGANGYRELRLIEFTGPTTVGLPTLITEPGAPAMTNLLLPDGPTTIGHGFDAQGRIWYAYTNTMLSEPTTVGIALVTFEDGMVVERLELADNPPGTEFEEITFDADLQLLGYRSQTSNLSYINYVDLSADQPVEVRIDQALGYFDATPTDNASYGWSADGSRIAIAGVQGGANKLYVAEIGDPTGATVAIELPDVESAQGITLAHRPSVSPNGDQVILWYGTQTGLTGLIHGATDGSAPAEVVLGLQNTLHSGTYLPRTPTNSP
ncbi:hypothetical protein [Enhygromyxa salina]|uniref:Uncharacterized protein n=1 Tax=Enhygromyxa salina TaxID=215803 RepID=A0A2S9Y641_9BACT|nr:hypothetical protein [Enhygromyxa salina]PRQ00570.1 hypothetical protein ENSA7_60640 [Enhygromyxa salina]